MAHQSDHPDLFARPVKPRAVRTPAPNIYRDFLWHFKRQWERLYPGRQFVVTTKQYGQAKHLLAPVPGFPAITQEEALRRIDRFLANPHFKVCSHAFHKLLEHWDMFTETIAAERTVVRDRQEDVDLVHVCAGCGAVMRSKRSVWLQARQKTGICRKCDTTFNVNDVLNHSMSLKELLP